MAAISASAMAVSAVPQAVTASVASDKLASRSSVAFSSVKAFRPMTFLCRSSVRPLAVRAVDIPQGSENSTGDIGEKAKEYAEKAVAAIGGNKEDVDARLQDTDGRPLKSKTQEVKYGEVRNADEVGNKAQQVWNDVQSKFTKGEEK